MKFKAGDKVALVFDVLQRHSRTVPAHAGYSKEQFAWRDTLRKLNGKIGTIERTFENSKHVNVQFDDGTLIGINETELQSKEDFDSTMAVVDEIIGEIIAEEKVPAGWDHV